MRSFGSFLQFIVTITVFSELLAGCMVGPDFQSPKPPQAKAYTQKPLPHKTVSTRGAGFAGNAQYFADGQNIPAEWWFLFHSQALNELISQGLANSPNLAAAKSALIQAQETWNAQIGTSLYPALSAQVNATRQAFSDASFGQPGAAVFNLINPAFNIAYTLDVFGGARRQIEALAAQVDYQAFQLEAAYLTLTSNIVTTAINAASYQAQLRATRELVESQEKTLDLIKKQVRLGGASGADALTQETQVAQTRATLPPLEQSYAQSLHLLAVLIGAFPSESQLPSLDLNALYLPPHLPVSLPSALAHQRPDIRASEALLHAACAQVGVATANLYPQITLNGSYGWEKQSIGGLFSPHNIVWSIGTSVLQPIYNGGSLQAKRRAARAGFEQAAAQYRETVLQAFRNVADTLRALENDAKAFRAQNAAEIAAKKSLRMTKKQYQLGGVSYLNLLNAERQYQQTRIARIQAQAARYNDTVALFQALGGGWWNREVKLEKPGRASNAL